MSALQIYQKIPDPIVAAEKMSLPIAKVCGARSAEEGFVIALTCMVEGITPIEFSRKYHLIQGRPTMRSDAFLAQFRMAGGRHVVLEHSADRAAVKLTWEGQEYEFALTWAEAQESRWPWKDPGNHKAGLKDNWSTPLDRKSMLWARLISSSIKLLAPELCNGMYTPEEMNDVSDRPAPVAAPVNMTAVLQQHAQEEVQPAEAEVEVVAPVEMISAAQAETILDLYDLLDIGEHDQEAALHRRGVESLDQLTAEHAADMIQKLEVIKYRRGL